MNEKLKLKFITLSNICLLFFLFFLSFMYLFVLFISCTLIVYFLFGWLQYRRKLFNQFKTEVAKLQNLRKKDIAEIEDLIHSLEGLEGYEKRARHEGGEIFHEGTRFIVDSGVKPEDPYLDVGCALGDLMCAWRTYGCFGVGIDISRKRMVDAQKRIKSMGIRGDFLVADAESMPFREGAFKIVVASEVLEHLLNPRKAIEEIARVLKPTGIVYITVPNASCLSAFISRSLSSRRIKLLNPFQVIELFLSPYFNTLPPKTGYEKSSYESLKLLHLHDCTPLLGRGALHRHFTAREMRDPLKACGLEIRCMNTTKVPNAPIIRYYGGLIFVKATRLG